MKKPPLRLAMVVLQVLLLPACKLPEPRKPSLRAYAQEPTIEFLETEAKGSDNGPIGFSLYNPTGSIHVLNADVPVLETRLRISAESEESAQVIAKGCRLEQHVDGDWLRLELWPPEGSAIEGIGIDFILKIPMGSKLHLRSRHGLIDTTRARIDEMELQTQGGTIRTGEIKSLLNFSNRSGKTLILGGFSSIKGWSHNGELLIRKFPRDGNLVFESRLGRATLFIKKEDPVFIDYETYSGKLVSDLSFSRESSALPKSWKRETLKFNGGTACCQVLLRLEFGSLQLWAD